MKIDINILSRNQIYVIISSQNPKGVKGSPFGAGYTKEGAVKNLISKIYNESRKQVSIGNVETEGPIRLDYVLSTLSSIRLEPKKGE